MQFHVFGCEFDFKDHLSLMASYHLSSLTSHMTSLILRHNLAGVIALMLEASNFTATSRDIQHTLVATATPPSDAKAQRNGAGLMWSNKV